MKLPNALTRRRERSDLCCLVADNRHFSRELFQAVQQRLDDVHNGTIHVSFTTLMADLCWDTPNHHDPFVHEEGKCGQAREEGTAAQGTLTTFVFSNHLAIFLELVGTR